MNKRTTKPENGNKFYNTIGNGGYSRCIKGSPTDPGCDVYSNCVGHSCGRFNEVLGSMKFPGLNCNAENFIERAISLGLQIVSKPSLGGIMVFQKGATLSGNDGAGHVMNVEAFYENGDVLVSESGYGSSNPFWTTRRSNVNGRWGMGSGYTYRGCIVNPAIGYKPFEPAPAPTPVDPNAKTYTVVKGDTLSGIASKYGTTYQELARINNIADPNIIHIGQVIVLPGGVIPTPEPKPVPQIDMLTIVKRTIRGDFKNEPYRTPNLRNEGLNDEQIREVQKQVNLNYNKGTTRWDNVRLY